MSFICTKCQIRFAELVSWAADEEAACPSCKSTLDIIDDDGRELVKPAPKFKKYRHKPFYVDQWRDKRAKRAELEAEALDEYHRTGDKEAYFKKLKEINGTGSTTGDSRTNESGQEPGKV